MALLRSSSFPAIPVGTIGDSVAFGSINSFGITASNQFLVLDGLMSRLSLYSSQGQLLFQIGRKGEGPGEFVKAVALGVTSDDQVYVADEASGRLSIFSIDTDSLLHLHDVRLPFRPRDLCLIEDRLFLAGRYQGNLVHEVGADGTVLRSFASEPEGDPLELALASIVRIECSSEQRRIALAPRQINQIRVFSETGESQRMDSIPGFVGTVYDRAGGAVRPILPPQGYAHQTENMEWFLDGLLIQLGRSPPPDTNTLDAKWFLPDGGWEDQVPSWPRIIGITPAGEIFTAEEDPFPIIRRYVLK